MSRLSIVALLGVTACATPAPLSFTPGTGYERKVADREASVTLVDRCRVDFEPHLRGVARTRECHRAVRIGAQAASSRWVASIPLDPGEALIHAEGTVRSSGGDEPTRQALLTRVTEPEPSIPDQVSLVFSDLRPGDVVEYRFQTFTRRSVGVYHHDFSGPQPRLTTSVEITAPVGTTLWQRRPGVPPPDVTTHAGRARWTWRVDGLPADRPRALRPPPSRFGPSLHVALRYVPGARDTGATYPSWPGALRPAWDRIEAAMVVEAGGAAPPTGGQLRILVELWWFEVQRRVADERGTRRTSIRPAPDVLESGRGTADERAVVLLAALRSKGVPAALVLIPGRGEADIDPEVPIPGRFDLLVAIPRPRRSPILLDPRCHGCRAGDLTPAHRGRRGLWLRKSLRNPDATVSVAPLITPDDDGRRGAPGLEVRQQLRIREERRLTIDSAQWTFRGDRAAQLRDLAYRIDADDEGLAARLLEEQPGAHAGAAARVIGVRERGPVHVQFEDLRGPFGALTRSADHLMIPAGVGLPLDVVEHHTRTATVFVEPRPHVVHQMRVLIPEGYEVAALPEASMIERPGVTYRRTVKEKSDAVDVQEELRISRRHIGPQFAQAAQAIRQARAANIVFRRVGAPADATSTETIPRRR